MKATLVRGNVHYLGNKRFDKGVAVPVTAEEAERLEATVQVVQVNGEPVELERFKIEEPVKEVEESEEKEPAKTPSKKAPSRRKASE